MAEVTKLEGAAVLAKQLRALSDGPQAVRVLRTGVSDAMKEVMEDARASVPVGTREHKTYKGRNVKPGFAKKSLRVVSFINKARTQATALLGVRSEAFYVLQFLELGTSRIARRPWLTPAFEKSQNRSIQKIGEAMRKRINEIASKR